jgi:hypothetical protein
MIQFTVTDEHQIVVPLAFKRGSDDDLPHMDSPELDDRGFRRGRDQSGLSATDSRGPMIGLMVDSTVKIRAAREDIDDSAPIFISVTDADKIEIVAPQGGGPVPADGIFQIKGKTARGAPGKVQARLGSATGPVLAELEPHIFGRLRVPIQPHLVTINTASATGTEPNIPIDTMIRRIRAIWWPCGIEIVHDTAARPTVHDTIQLSRVDLCNPPGADSWGEIKQVLGLQRTRLSLAAGTNDPALNWYIVQDFRQLTAGRTWWGWGVSRTTANGISSTDTGIITAAAPLALPGIRGAEMMAKMIAHEIGHFFTLHHAQDRNYDNPALDTYARRMLMYPNLDISPFASPPTTLENGLRINNVGYGNREGGCLLTLKRHLHHASDGEAARARGAIVGGNWM